MTKDITLERLIRAERDVQWSGRRVSANWNQIDRAVRSGRKALPIAIAPLALGLFPAIAKAGFVALAITASAGSTVWIYQATEPVHGSESSQPMPRPQSATATSSPDRGPLQAVEGPSAEPEPPATLEAQRDRIRQFTAPQSSSVEKAAAVSTGDDDAGGSIEAELALLRSVKRSLDRGELSTARSELREHAARFPRGIVADERRALELIVDCSERRSAEARARAQKYASAHPRSIHRSAIARACDLGANSPAESSPAAPAPTAPPVDPTRVIAPAQPPSPAAPAAPDSPAAAASSLPAAAASPTATSPQPSPPTATFAVD